MKNAKKTAVKKKRWTGAQKSAAKRVVKTSRDAFKSARNAGSASAARRGGERPTERVDGSRPFDRTESKTTQAGPHGGRDWSATKDRHERAPRWAGTSDGTRNDRVAGGDRPGGWRSRENGSAQGDSGRGFARDHRQHTSRDDRQPWRSREDRGSYRDNRVASTDDRFGGATRSDQSSERSRSDRSSSSDRPPWRGRDDRGGDRNRDFGGDRQPWRGRDERGGDRQPWRGRDERGGDRQPWRGRDERGGDSNRDFAGDRQPWRSRDDRGGDRPDRTFDRGTSSRPHSETRSDHQPWRSRDPRSTLRNDQSGARDRREGGYSERRDDRSPGSKNETQGFSADRGGRKPWQDRADDRGDRKPWQDRAEGRGDRKPWQDRAGLNDARRDLPRAASSDRPRANHHRDMVVRQEREVVERRDTPLPDDNAFLALGVSRPIVEVLWQRNIDAPFPIQQASLPDAIAGRDILGRGQTGSGKTLAFGLPTLTRIAAGRQAAPHRPTALIMVPTRELAMQVCDALKPLAKAVDRSICLVAGGLSYTPQIRALEAGVDLLVATPGRLQDLMERQAVDLKDVQVLILDEADHMAEMGFMEDIEAVMATIPEGAQKLLFSATLDHGVQGVVERYLKDAVTHSTDDAQARVTTMDHHILLIEPRHKKAMTADIANREGRTVVFVRTKLGADRVAEQLREEGVFAAALHGGLNQNARQRVLECFKQGTIPVLVATDVAARGIHVDDVTAVIQADPPADHKDYLHRAGRTARAGQRGVVVTLALPHQRKSMSRIAEQAGLETQPREVRLGDPHVVEATGARRAEGDPIPDEALRRLISPPAPANRGGRRPGGWGGNRDRGRRPEWNQRRNDRRG